ncbi:cation diffusion facilitator family transporter [Sphingomonas naphthae]|uniref:Cation diffusion facilitator family transporter n=1 Tax=Sphingomonas naphthae TaxID=1813468 RepID=A0ABY7TQG3_9SPHN|nr:cation diffusion facilitator family transporter [Sphingomonas naphthae]WCT74605.1 cation diffusion facilitator family transporter [Sphingomonas naphthae]
MGNAHGHDHAGHSHADHDHSGHGHSGHDHKAHGHAGHSHGHHGHSHAPSSFGRAFAIGIALNTGFVVAEGLAGVWAGSIALMADAGHNLSDVLGLILAWVGHSLSSRPASPRFTYGLRSSSILAALGNAVLLILASGAIAWEAVRRLIEDGAQPMGGVVMATAAIGVIVNLATAMLFHRGQHDLNIRGAYLHMAADAGVSAGVVIAGLIVAKTGWLWIDPVTSLVIVAVILLSTWGLLRDSLALSLHGVPRGVDLKAVAARLGGLPGVAHVHHIHIWPTSTTETALTAHLVMPAGATDAFLSDTAGMLEQDFTIGHATLQVERGGDCAHADCE